MSRPVVVVGAGGFGREVVDVIEAINNTAADRGGAALWHLEGVVDDFLSPENRERLSQRGIQHLGSTDDFLDRAPKKTAYVVGIGAPRVRQRVATALDAAGLTAVTLVHPAATIGSHSQLGAGTVVCAGARITTNIVIGRHVQVNPNATIGHDTTVGDFVSLNPQAAISGDCVIESLVLVGVGGIVLNALWVGQGAVIGGAACAVRDVAAGTTVVGIPARPLRSPDVTADCG